MKTNIERRFLSVKVELRAAAEGKPAMVAGYAAVYGSPSNTLRSSRGDFVEVIEPGFFDSVLNDDVRALFNHDDNFVLARSNAGKGTLRIFSDERGLAYEFEAPDTTAGRDLSVSLTRGDIDQSSFAFSIKQDGDKWDRRSDGVLVRTLRAGGCARLHDVSPVTYPAYPDTEVCARSASLDQFLDADEAKKAPQQPPLDLWERRLASIRNNSR
jgi:HK97 family phage prohead protease